MKPQKVINITIFTIIITIIFINLLVYFDNLDDDTIAAYVATGDPMDKAGSYGIQSIASSFVSKISGCYFNVVGFPIHRFTKELLLML